MSGGWEGADGGDIAEQRLKGNKSVTVRKWVGRGSTRLIFARFEARVQDPTKRILRVLQLPKNKNRWG